MSSANVKVMAMVERALKKDPTLRARDLQTRAIRVDESIGELSGRQFHARYALPARRRLFRRASSERRPKKRLSTGESSRQPITAMVTERYHEKKARLDQAIDAAFARILEADSVKQLNRLLASIDRRAREFEKV